MLDLAVNVISWNRPAFLEATLASLFSQCVSVQADIFVVDNGSEAATRQVIFADERLAGQWLLGRNFGINAALELVVPEDLERHYEFLLISDADMCYQKPLKLGMELLRARPEIGVVSYQHSPEHAVLGNITKNSEEWHLKATERGCAMLFRAADFGAFRPLPVDNLKDFDWWIVRDAPRALQTNGREIAVLPGGARHLGWRRGDSTWQPEEVPEFAEYRT